MNTRLVTKPIRMMLYGVAAFGLANAGAVQGAEKAVPTADRMIAQCLDYAVAQKMPPVSIGVIDQAGALVAFRRQPGASAASAEVALLKARTALRLNAPTSVLAEAASADPSTRDTFLMLQMTTIPGGIPLPGADESVAGGAVGVSGAMPEQDAACAQKALDTPSRK